MKNSPCETCEGMVEQVQKYKYALGAILNECLYNTDTPKKVLKEVNKIATLAYGSNAWNFKKAKGYDNSLNIKTNERLENRAVQSDIF